MDSFYDKCVKAEKANPKRPKLEVHWNVKFQLHVPCKRANFQLTLPESEE